MVQVDPEVERLVDQVLDQLLQHNYRRDRLSQGLFLCALDLNHYFESHPNEADSEFERLYQQTWEMQPEWVLNNIRDADLPLGITDSVVEGHVDLVEFDDPRVDREFLMYPGEDFFEILVRQYYPLICGEYSIQSLADKTDSGKNLYRDCALILISGMVSGPKIPFVVLGCVLALHVIEERVDAVCDEYSPQ